MNRSRRALLLAFGGAALLGKGAPRAIAQSYPAKPVRMIVAWPPGSATDLAARLIAQKLGQSMGQTFLVENRPGASGIVGTEVVARAAPDGHMLILSTASHASNKLVFGKLPFDPIADFAPIAIVYRSVLSVVVHPSFPVQTLAEFLQYAKAKPGVLSFGTSGVGTSHQLGGELLKRRAGIDIVHIPYKGGGPAVIDLVSGQIPVAVASLAAVMPFIRTGRLRALAVMGSSRYEELPDVPTVAETFPGFHVSGWTAMFAPAGTSGEIVTRLNFEIARLMKDPDVSRTMKANGMVVSVSTPEELAKLVREDIDRWASLVKAGVKVK